MAKMVKVVSVAAVVVASFFFDGKAYVNDLNARNNNYDVIGYMAQAEFDLEEVQYYINDCIAHGEDYAVYAEAVRNRDELKVIVANFKAQLK